MARLTLRSRSGRGTTASQRFTWLVENISPPIAPKPPGTGTAPPRRHDPRQLLGRLRSVGQGANSRSDGIDGIQPRNLAAAHDN
jgi:hypothetical protein